jgi:hypothetical protein
MTPDRHISESPSVVSPRQERGTLSRISQHWKLRLATIILALSSSTDISCSHRQEQTSAPVAVGEAPSHGPTAITHFTREEVATLLADRIDIAEMEDVEEECIDGREEEAVAGIPGASLGTIEAEVTAIKKITGKRPNRAQIAAFMAMLPRINMHTDHHKEEDLEKALADDAELSAALKEKGMEELAVEGTGSKELNEKLAKKMAKIIGCGFFAKMELDPAAFGVEPGVAEEIIEEALLAKWENRSKVQRKVLHGGHEEGAVAAVSVEGGIQNEKSPVPLVKPSKDGKQIFIYTKEVAQFKFKKHLPLWEKVLGQKLDAEAFQNTAAETLDAQTNAIAGLLAKGRHLMPTSIDPKHPEKATVKDVGVIGQ